MSLLQEIYLEGALPAQSQLLVSESATEAQEGEKNDPAVVLAGKVTLSVISMDNQETEDGEFYYLKCNYVRLLNLNLQATVPKKNNGK